ncbi:MAG: hypothetical protein DRI52_03900 [Chloroflexi bacterium]|nr:MAG: hypothetical protein DRI52_03900 [Chloroflexota bacterium]
MFCALPFFYFKYPVSLSSFRTEADAIKSNFQPSYALCEQIFIFSRQHEAIFNIFIDNRIRNAHSPKFGLIQMSPIHERMG